MFPSQKLVPFELQPAQTKLLQWGRDVSIPEIRKIRRVPVSGSHASMGPGCFHPRNSSVNVAGACLFIASMGPGCFHPRNSLTFASGGSAHKLQWGRDVSIPEMISHCAGSPPPTRLQWGRDVSIPEMANPLLYSIFHDLRALPRAPLHFNPTIPPRTTPPAANPRRSKPL